MTDGRYTAPPRALLTTTLLMATIGVGHKVKWQQLVTVTDDRQLSLTTMDTIGNGFKRAYTNRMSKWDSIKQQIN